MTIDSLLSQLGKGVRDRRASSPRSSVHLDEIGALPPGIAAAPDAPGAALHDVLALVQQQVPGATGLLVRDGQLFVAYEQPPDEASRAAARAAIADEPTRARLASRAAAASEPDRGQLGSRSAAAASPTVAGELRAQLLDPQLPDDAWLRAFRRYQVALLSAVEPATPPDDTRPSKPRRGDSK